MVLLDPVSYPGAIKAFAKEVCRNDLLNFGRLHFFFPDSRLALDLNTDKTLKVGGARPPVSYLLVQYSRGTSQTSAVSSPVVQSYKLLYPSEMHRLGCGR